MLPAVRQITRITVKLSRRCPKDRQRRIAFTTICCEVCSGVYHFINDSTRFDTLGYLDNIPELTTDYVFIELFDM